MPRVSTELGYAIGYAERGAGDGDPIIFLHGVGSDKSVWDRQLAYFGQSRRALSFDYPGYGESDDAPAGTTRDDFASAILSAMHSLGIARAHICGLSLGGIVAIALHHASAEACASLILADTFAVHPEGNAIYERALAGSDDLASMAEARVDLLIARPADPAVRREVVETMARITPGAYRTGASAVWLADQRDRARSISVPTLVLVGGADRITPPELSRELVALIEGGQLQILEEAGHLANIERPADFNRHVGDFISAAEQEGLGLLDT